MKVIKYFSVVLSAAMLLVSCNDDFLDNQPKGTVSGDQLNTPKTVEDMVVAAYSAIGNDHWTVPFGSMWAYGSVRSDDSYKGGGGTGDVGDFNNYELFTFNRPNQGSTDLLWYRLYVGVSRANDALARINNLSETEYPQKVQREAEMRFVRGHFNFMLKILFKQFPYIDETKQKDEYAQISNVEYTSDELWEKVADDFRFAAENLSFASQEVGRPSQSTAKAYLAKALLYQAYEQDAQHSVVNVNRENLEQVVTLVDEITGSYALQSDYGQNFLWQYENNQESVFAIQRSVDDGTPNGRLDMGSALNYPMGSTYGCCWFNIPSQNLVNSYQTDQNGLPKFDTYDATDLVSAPDFKAHTVDPRVNHTVGIPGQPWKYQPSVMYERSWARTPELYGVFSSMKEVQQPDCACLRKVGPFFASSKNNVVIRYADVLLWKAEALIELGRQDEALPLINSIRERAQNSTGMLKDANGNLISDFRVDTYKPGVNIDWTQENARKALRWERRLEFAMEGIRFFDLVRWGIAAETLNAYFDSEETKRQYLKDAQFQKGRDEYLPIPQQQIDFSKGLYKQNANWN
ncbi:RagB/SusD family nutrient uptake outer membrane protein [Pontibacter sp. E15-1]|uniref:RagB/SusD family nutrient uptake outer membrane protein n=1 Tax=Pontibacter sp. E15-1 TaxID=2919918 RepID=UPI001F4FCB6B|nr:RagB/SusD family nutrient uptake outer membrane protein [Pontibacter sp. E15-1]MCJ8167304.1 RagB/SusD family nutrient uptake outer membrane protein [Pontibacter sp. E15-1]